MKEFLLGTILLPLAVAAAIPVVVVERNQDGSEQSVEVGKLYEIESRGTDGILFEFVPDSIFKDGFDPR